jgi:hypothetical protein
MKMHAIARTSWLEPPASCSFLCSHCIIQLHGGMRQGDVTHSPALTARHANDSIPHERDDGEHQGRKGRSAEMILERVAAGRSQWGLCKHGTIHGVGVTPTARTRTAPLTFSCFVPFRISAKYHDEMVPEMMMSPIASTNVADQTSQKRWYSSARCICTSTSTCTQT